MKLYYSPGACSQAPHIALQELGLPFEKVKVDLVKHTLADGSDYRAVNPKGYVPFLVLDDGTTLSEANVVLQYIADQKPGQLAPVFGTRERWKLMEWLAFIATEVHKGFGPLWNPKSEAAVRERTVQALGNRFTLIAETLSKQPFLTGDKFTVADAYLFVVLNWSGHLKVDLSRWPALQQFQARVAARPAVQATLRAEGLVK
jgi:glutathione S-transferase